MTLDTQGREFTNGYDQTLTVMEPVRQPTYEYILALPDHSECLAVWANGDINCYDVDAAFKSHMREGMREHGDSPTDPAGPRLIVVVRPNRMSPMIVDALRLKENRS